MTTLEFKMEEVFEYVFAFLNGTDMCRIQALNKHFKGKAELLMGQNNIDLVENIKLHHLTRCEINGHCRMTLSPLKILEGQTIFDIYVRYFGLIKMQPLLLKKIRQANAECPCKILGAFQMNSANYNVDY